MEEAEFLTRHPGSEFVAMLCYPWMMRGEYACLECIFSSIFAVRVDR